jgi:hypothetical protein
MSGHGVESVPGLLVAWANDFFAPVLSYRPPAAVPASAPGDPLDETSPIPIPIPTATPQAH